MMNRFTLGFNERLGRRRAAIKIRTAHQLTWACPTLMYSGTANFQARYAQIPIKPVNVPEKRVVREAKNRGRLSPSLKAPDILGEVA